MSTHTLTTRQTSARSHFSLFGWARLKSSRLPRLDLEGLPEHLKRDLGFGGGREAPPRDLLRD